MPVIRFIFAVLIGFSLAVTPVAAAMAKPMAAMEHCDKKGMNAKGLSAKAMSDCCCDKANACPADTCAMKCFKTTCAFSTATKTFGFLSQTYERSLSESVALSTWPPPAPPPRV